MGGGGGCNGLVINYRWDLHISSGDGQVKFYTCKRGYRKCLSHIEGRHNKCFIMGA